MLSYFTTKAFQLLILAVFLSVALTNANAQTCTGTPNAGTVYASDYYLCYYDTYVTLTATGLSTDSVLYVWQANNTTLGSWTNIPCNGIAPVSGSVTSENVVLSGQTETTQYRLVSLCLASGLSNTTNAVSIGYNYCYCMPSFTIGNTSGTYINSISINGYSNVSGANAPPPNYLVSNNIPLTLTPGASYSLVFETGTSDSCVVGAWIDFNGDGDFVDAFESIFQSFEPSSNAVDSIVFAIPIGAGIGPKLMRFRINKIDSSYIDACLNYQYGETEDYGINIAYPSCTGTPSGGVVNGPDSVIVGNSFSVFVTGASSAPGITAQWQSSIDNGFTWTNITGAIGGSYTTTQISDHCYRRIINCTPSGLSDVSSVHCISTATCAAQPTITSVTSDIDSTLGYLYVALTGGPEWLIVVDPGNGDSAINYSASSSSAILQIPYDSLGIYTACVIAYSICGGDTSSASDSVCVTINQICPYPPLVDGFSNDVTTCYGNSDGMIDLWPTSDFYPLTYLWSNGATDEDVINLSAGDYCVTVTDANGCSADNCFTIYQPWGLQVDALVTNDSSTATWDIDLSVFGGIAPYNYIWSNGSNTEDINAVLAGDYCVTVIDVNGCTIDTCLTIGIITCDTMYTTTYIAASDTSFVLTMDSAIQAMAVSYSWDFGDGSGTTTNPFPVHTYAVTGIYTVCLTITTSNGAMCSYCHDIGVDSLGNVVTRMDLAGFIAKVVPFGSTSVNNISNPEFFNVYPNPIGDKGTLSFYASASANYTINIYNTLGQKLETQIVNAQAGHNDIQLKTQKLPKGLYLVTVQFDDNQISRSFVK